jgi:hypothetical protein
MQEVSVVGVDAYGDSRQQSRDSPEYPSLGHVCVHDVGAELAKQPDKVDQRSQLSDKANPASQTTESDHTRLRARLGEVVAFFILGFAPNDDLFKGRAIKSVQ